MGTHYFVHDVTRVLYRSTGPHEVWKWLAERHEWSPRADADGYWLWRAWGFGGHTDLTSVSETEAREHSPEAFDP